MPSHSYKISYQNSLTDFNHEDLENFTAFLHLLYSGQCKCVLLIVVLWSVSFRCLQKTGELDLLMDPVLETPLDEVASLVDNNDEEVFGEQETFAELDILEQSLLFEGFDAGAEKSAQCPVGWHKHGPRCYHFVNIAARWAQAERHCLAFGGNLASVHSISQYQFLQNVIKMYSYGYPDTWIGANDAIQEGIWLWSDGSRYDFRYWSGGNPDNAVRPPGNDNTNGREHCLEMNWGGENRWNDAPCWFEKPFICSRKL
ncbi:hypothetical protein UPYG_G00299060 [Umbra pygmaea]|uniref:C-type lectin domain-containing protein n=1 Tax=Umbra pygmaea TaxID=75934 RepID=A0ABD0WAE5_UMBPY